MPRCSVILFAITMLGLTGCSNHAAQPATPPTAPSLAGPISVPAAAMAGNVQQVQAPLYPPEAKAQKKQGTVILHAIIGKDGSVRDVTVISGPELFREAAVRAVQQWKYKPYHFMGKVVDVDTTITVNFRL